MDAKRAREVLEAICVELGRRPRRDMARFVARTLRPVGLGVLIGAGCIAPGCIEDNDPDDVVVTGDAYGVPGDISDIAVGDAYGIPYDWDAYEEPDVAPDMAVARDAYGIDGEPDMEMAHDADRVFDTLPDTLPDTPPDTPPDTMLGDAYGIIDSEPDWPILGDVYGVPDDVAIAAADALPPDAVGPDVGFPPNVDLYGIPD